MLINDLYTALVLQPEEAVFRAEIRLNPAHPVFQGHFPGQPVLPGVCMMQIVSECLALWLEEPWVLRSAGQVKFLRLIDPAKTPVFQADIRLESRDAGELRLSAQFTESDSTIFKMQGASYGLEFPAASMG